jgi:DNA-binding transcriptional MerR regulator
MKEYATKDIVNIVSIAPPTVRKYAQALEKAGYKFLKNDRGFRIFTDKDILIFKEMFQKSTDTGMNVEQIALMLVSQQKGNMDTSTQTISEVATPRENEVQTSNLLHIESEVKELKELVHKQSAMMLELMKQMDERDLKRNNEWTEFVRENMQFRKQIAATQEEEKKKGFWQRLFGK